MGQGPQTALRGRGSRARETPRPSLRERGQQRPRQVAPPEGPRLEGGSDRQGGPLSRPASGVILAGGRARRMGREKLSLEVNGLSMIERVYEALAGTCREVLVVGGEGQGPATVRYVADQRPGRQGPLAGIEAGLGASNYEQVFVAAGDMPFLTEDLANHLLDLLERNHVPAVIPRFGTRTHPLCGAYARALLPRVSSALDGGIRAV